METEKVIAPQQTTIVSFKTSKNVNWPSSQKRRLKDKNGKRVRCKIMDHRNGKGTLMLPNSYLKSMSLKKEVTCL